MVLDLIVTAWLVIGFVGAAVNAAHVQRLTFRDDHRFLREVWLYSLAWGLASGPLSLLRPPRNDRFKQRAPAPAPRPVQALHRAASWNVVDVPQEVYKFGMVNVTFFEPSDDPPPPACRVDGTLMLALGPYLEDCLIEMPERVRALLSRRLLLRAAWDTLSPAQRREAIAQWDAQQRP